MKVWNVLDYGAKRDGVTNDAPAIQKAIDECTAAGGGRVYVPAGQYMCGTIDLKDNVDLHLERGASLVASFNEADVKIVEHPDGRVEDSGYFVGSFHAKNVSLTGFGELYGQGYKVMFDDGADGDYHECPLMSEGFRPRLTYLEDVENLTIRDITFRDSSLWTLHMAGCRRVLIQGIKILNNNRGANNDGIDPDSCQDVVISDCFIETGDDAIVVKTTKPITEKYGPCENILIRGCVLASRDSALKIGTETHGDIRNIVMSDCVVQNCSRAVGIWVRDGATIEDIMVHHITGAMRRYANSNGRHFAPDWWGKGEPIFISATHRRNKPGFAGTIRNITFDHIRVTAESSLFIRGEEINPICNVQLQDINITMKKQGTQATGFFDEQPSSRDVYPHEIPAIYARYANGLELENVKVTWVAPMEEAWSGLLQLEDCENVVTEKVQEIKA